MNLNPRNSKSLGVIATYKSVDTCAAEFEAYHAVLLFDVREEDEDATQIR